MTDSPEPCNDLADRLKHTAALALALVHDAKQFAMQVVPGDDDRAALAAVLGHVETEVLERVFDDLDEPLYYSAGWPVVTRTELGMDCSCSALHVWGPRRVDEANRPRELLALPCPRGGRHRLVVLGPGELEVIDAL